MTIQHTPQGAEPIPIDRRAAVVGGIALVLLGLLAAGLVALVALGPGAGSRGGDAGAEAATPDPASFAYADVRPAPALELTDQEGSPFSLASLRGHPVLVFFGYTHCPDVCPTTVGVVNQVLITAGDGPRAVFVSIDPDRDDVAAMKQYLQYLPKAYVGLSGSPAEVRRNAEGWGVKYARIETGSANGYAMAHTADVFLVDAQGLLRAHFPFGTQADPIVATLRALSAETAATTSAPTAPPAGTPTSPPTPAPTAAPSTGTATAAPTGGLTPLAVSSSIWAGGASPIILTIADAAGVGLDGSVPVTVALTPADGSATSVPDVRATAIRPEGATHASFVAVVDIPAPGSWTLQVRTGDGRSGSAVVQALDPGSTAALGRPAPAVDTPTLDDVAGVVRAVTTQPNPDLRFSRTSTADALAAGRPYVLVVDSARFKVSPACGRALTMARFLLDRWPDVTFVHLEPFEYQLVTEEPVLNGTLTDPPLNRYARAFGLGPAPWPGTAMPWIFVVDGQGIVRAKYTGIVGSADVDVIVSLILGRGVVPN